MLLLLEVLLRSSHRLDTYSEQNFAIYQSAFDASALKKINVWNKTDSIYSVQTEFAFSYLTNSYGLLKRSENACADTSNALVFLGDSFTFGVGADQDSSLPVYLEKQLHQPIINAGIPGSDPFFEKVLVDSIFKPLGYKKYIMMINFSDIYDFVIRGGTERFEQNNSVSYRSAPWIEGAYKHSHLVRAFVHKILGMDYSLLPNKQMKVLKEDAIKAYTALLLSFSKEADCLIVLQPYPRQYANNNTLLYEVLNYTYLEKLDSSLRANDIKTINLDPKLKKLLNSDNYLDYFWELDGHYNAKGYALLGEIIAEELTLNYPEFITQKE